MDAAMKSLNLEKISALMDKFEKQFEDLDVQSSYMVSRSIDFPVRSHQSSSLGYH